MKKNEWQEILKKCFGKEKDDRYHAIAMLAIYGFFILILVVLIRVGGNNTSTNLSENNNTSTAPTSTASPTSEPEIDEEDSISGNDINYSYSYTISYNGVTEVYLGKKIDNKEKFTLVKDGITTDYAILNDNYLILENGTYHITENPSKFFKYCDIEKILLLVENEIPTENSGIVKYTISNQSLVSSFKDTISIDNNQNNSIQLHVIENTLKSVDLDFSNYFSSITGESVILKVHMEFADIGTTEDFDVKMS